MIVAVVLVLITSVLACIYLVGNHNENYWKKRGVTFHRKNRVMGPFWDFITLDRSLYLLFQDIYKQYPNEPAVAFGAFLTPSLYVKDFTNISHVMQTDFRSFNHRAFAFNESDKLALNIALLYGPRWKLLRQSMTPLFTASKLKQMFYIIDRIAQDFVHFLKSNPKNLKGDSFETFNTYSWAALAASIFGIGNAPSLESPFLTIIKKALTPTFWRNIKFSVSKLSTTLFRAMGMTLFSVDEDFFIGAIKQALKRREEENLVKHDFIDLCLKLQKNGTMYDLDTGFEMEPTDEILAAQAFSFLLAGTEPCSSTIYNTFVVMGRSPDILQRVREEIDDKFEKFNGQLTYDAVSEMEYLDSVINESLRIYPSAAFLTRECVQDTVLPVGNIKVDKGTKIYIPVYEFHRDPKYYADPDAFDPERFSRDGKQNINDAIYMPFGKGNRTCIGQKYAMLQMKACISHVLRHFNVKIVVHEGGIKYKKEQFQVRLDNVALEFIPRTQEN